MELTAIQKEILQELITIYEKKNTAVKGTEIARKLNRNPGTIRNQMQALRALNLVDGVPGPKGGYVPTSEAYRAVGLLSDTNEIIVPIYKNGEVVKGIYVEKIIFDTVAHEKSCSSMIHIKGDTKLFNSGDLIKVGPTYHNKIVIFGKVIGRDDINHIILLDVICVSSIPNLNVSDVAIPREKLIVVNPNITIKEVSEIFCKYNINGAPVLDEEGDNLLGIITLHDIAKALSNNEINEKVEKYMSKPVITINPNKKIYDALITMDKNNIGRLIVVDENGKVIGIITRTDILKLIEGFLFSEVFDRAEKNLIKINNDK